jgi:hypothetical protein
MQVAKGLYPFYTINTSNSNSNSNSNTRMATAAAGLSVVCEAQDRFDASVQVRALVGAADSSAAGGGAASGGGCGHSASPGWQALCVCSVSEGGRRGGRGEGGRLPVYSDTCSANAYAACTCRVCACVCAGGVG